MWEHERKMFMKKVGEKVKENQRARKKETSRKIRLYREHEQDETCNKGYI